MDDDQFNQAKRLFIDGVTHFEAGRLAEAEAHFEAALALLPERVSTQLNLAATRIKLGRAEAALPLLDAALAAEPERAAAGTSARWR